MLLDLKKLKYKDALVYFSRDLKKKLHEKKVNIERTFMYVCKQKLSEELFNEIYAEAERLRTGE